MVSLSIQLKNVSSNQNNMCGYESCIYSPGMYSSLISMGSLQYNKLEDRSRDTQNIMPIEKYCLNNQNYINYVSLNGDHVQKNCT